MFYLVGIVCASWHFAYGLWLFAAKWGITQGDRSRAGALDTFVSDCNRVYECRVCNDVFIPVHAAATISARGRRNGFVHDAVRKIVTTRHRDTEKKILGFCFPCDPVSLW